MKFIPENISDLMRGLFVGLIMVQVLYLGIFPYPSFHLDRMLQNSTIMIREGNLAGIVTSEIKSLSSADSVFLPRNFHFDKTSGFRNLEIYHGHQLSVLAEINQSNGDSRVISSTTFGSFLANPRLTKALSELRWKPEYHVKAIRAENPADLVRLKEHFDKTGVFYGFSEFHTFFQYLYPEEKFWYGPGNVLELFFPLGCDEEAYLKDLERNFHVQEL
ncbi:MAG: hypothetical protein PHW04_10525 [Candidatus Wallbacteria bacterium]|nr:hypothetical protein [Candidatus Wallbacteria bacterium]